MFDNRLNWKYKGCEIVPVACYRDSNWGKGAESIDFGYGMRSRYWRINFPDQTWIHVSTKPKCRNYIDSMDIQIKALVIEWGKHPYDINSGSCSQFAQEIMRRVEGATLEWDDKFDHCYIVYKGKYYDAECPHGVKQCHHLPLYQNAIAILDEENLP